MQEELISAMSNEDLAGLKDKYGDNPSVVTLIDGILETRQAEAEQAKAQGKFSKGIAKLFATLPHPDDVHNVYVRWGEVDVPDGEVEPVEVIDTPAVVDDDGNITTPAVTHTEDRTPTHKENQWIVEVNHTTRVTSGGSGDTAPKTSKRAITVFKRDGTTLIPKGNFASASKACEALGSIIGGDSAMRVLARDGYITEAYTGTDFS